MYSLAEIIFFILYFLGQAIKISAILLAIQVIVYRLTGFSIYKFAMKATDKLVKENF